MLKAYLLFTSLFFFLSNACKSHNPLNDADLDRNGIELIVQENYSGFDDEQFFIIKSQDDLHSFYGRVNRTRKPGLTPPVIDFNKEMILVWCAGKEVSGHSELEIWSDENTIFVQELISDPKRIRKI